jgi:hypothetical protein
MTSANYYSIVEKNPSTGDGVSTTLMNPVANNHQATNSEDDSWYQPSRSPEFDPDLLGGE